MTPPPDQGSGRAGDAIIAPLQPPANVHLDDTSDNILKPLDGYAKSMTGKLGGLYNIWRTHDSRNLSMKLQPAYGEGDEENHLLQELKGFGFGYIFGASERAANLGAAAKAGSDAEAQVKQKLAAAWKGKAADSAGEKLDDFGKALGDYTTAVNGFGQLLRSLWDTVRPPILHLAATPTNCGSAQTFLNLHKEGDCDGLGMFIDHLNKAIQFGRDPNSWGADGYASKTGGTGPIAPQDIRNMAVDLDDGADSKYSHDLCSQMDEYCQQYSNGMAEFRQNIRDAHTAAMNALRAFSDGLNVPVDPFGGLSLGASAPGPGNGHGPGTGGPGPTTGSGPGPGTSSGPGPGTGSVSPPQVSVPEQPKPPEQPSQTQPDTNPVTHQPLAIDPRTGQPYPIDPRTGQPVIDQPETVTVQQGDHQIEMTEPGADGKMEITVDNGSGHPKEYDLDWGDGTTPGQAGAVDASGNPLAPGQPGATDASGNPLAPGHAGYPAGSGAPGQAGYPAGTGAPGDAGYPAGSGAPGHAGYPAGTGAPGDAGYPAGTGAPGQAGYPAGAGAPGAGYPAGSGVPGQAGYPAGAGVPDGAAHPIGADGQPLVAGQPGYGPQGHDPGAFNPSTAYHPGPDGKIHITDGNLQITAERPEGAAGPTVVTVDDGSGHPTTYTLGSEHAGGHAQPDVGAAAVPGSAQVGPMPNPATSPLDASSHPGQADVGVASAAPGAPVDTPAHPAPLPDSTPSHGPAGDVHTQSAPEPALQQGNFSGAMSPAAFHDPAATGDLGVAAASTGDATTPQSVFDPLGGSAGTPQSVFNPLGSHDQSQHGDAALGQTVDPTSMHASGQAGQFAPSNPLGTAPDGAAPQQQSSSMGMMGGMMGGGAMGGGDQERSSAYRLEGSLFKNQNSGSNRISGSLDDEQPPRKP